MKRLNKKGFTMAELLIVVAIIAVLVAIAIPVFTTQLEKAKDATDAANLRAAYAEIVADHLTDESSTKEIEVTQKGTDTSWGSSAPEFSADFEVAAPTTAGSKWTVKWSGTKVTATK